MMMITKTQSKDEIDSKSSRVELDSSFALHYIDEKTDHIVYEITSQKALKFEDENFEDSVTDM